VGSQNFLVHARKLPSTARVLGFFAPYLSNIYFDAVRQILCVHARCCCGA
jgi:hypothetical protein